MMVRHSVIEICRSDGVKRQNFENLTFFFSFQGKTIPKPKPNLTKFQKFKLFKLKKEEAKTNPIGHFQSFVSVDLCIVSVTVMLRCVKNRLAPPTTTTTTTIGCLLLLTLYPITQANIIIVNIGMYRLQDLRFELNVARLVCRVKANRVGVL